MQVSQSTVADTSRPMMAYVIRPLEDSRWDQFLARHPRASVFHSIGWLRSLHQTYGYDVIALTSCPPESELDDGLVFCRVDSWLTGTRFVSLPFSDHCDPLQNGAESLQAFNGAVNQWLNGSKVDYVEIRPKDTIADVGLRNRSTRAHWRHLIDLTPDLDTLFSKLHKDSIQRKIRRAEREGLIYEEGTTDALLDAFFRLQLNTRRRHQIPPQPKDWFRNLISNFGDALKLRVAFKNDRAVAAILTLRHKDTLVYKYGCSDARFHSLGGMHLLLWNSIQDAKRNHLRVFDLGRSEVNNTGLVQFKDRWGSVRSELIYSRFSARTTDARLYGTFPSSWKFKIARSMFSYLPDRMLALVGSLLYKHIG
jgi:CelD/BcsL family acetyltransferase involved in cellulose biosynthesis